MNITLVLYCQYLHALPRLYDITEAYSSFFSQTLIILNIDPQVAIPTLAPPELRDRICVLRMPDPIHAGAALNKMFSHLQHDRVLLLDAQMLAKKEILTILRHWPRYDFDLKSSIVSFQPHMKWSKWPQSQRKEAPWKKIFHFVPTMSWGALFFDQHYILSLGGFDSQLSDEALTVELSWRVQKSTGILLETQDSLACMPTTLDRYEPHEKELAHLKAKYPDYYPSWRDFFRKIWSYIHSEKSAQNASEHSLN